CALRCDKYVAARGLRRVEITSGDSGRRAALSVRYGSAVRIWTWPNSVLGHVRGAAARSVSPNYTHYGQQTEFRRAGAALARDGLQAARGSGDCACRSAAHGGRSTTLPTARRQTTVPQQASAHALRDESPRGVCGGFLTNLTIVPCPRLPTTKPVHSRTAAAS